MLNKIQEDFLVAVGYVEENYKLVKEIFEFFSSYQTPNWSEGKITFQEIKEKIQLFTGWNTEIKAKIKDIPKGCLNINGSKVANHISRIL